MHRHPQLLGNMHMPKTRRVPNNPLRPNRPLPLPPPPIPLGTHPLPPNPLPRPIPRLDSASPSPPQNPLDPLAPLLDLAALERIHPRHQPRVLHHKRHQLRRIPPDAEELEPVLL